MVDATAKTNILGQPVVPFVGMDANHNSFNAFVSMIIDETIVSYVTTVYLHHVSPHYVG